jgi:uncharacterized protein YndB with AHSA1/START domain
MEKTENREMRITRTFKAPIELMWEVWTAPEHIMNRWGPKGFTSTISKMEVKEGGEWILTLQTRWNKLSAQKYFQGNYSV